MPFSRPFFLSAVIMAIAVAGCVAVSDALAPTSVILATGTPGGVYHPVGNAICRMFNLEAEHQTIACVAVSSDGSVANIRRIESGDSAFGLSQTDVAYAAFHGEGPFGAAGGPGGETDRGRSQGIGDRHAACSRACHDGCTQKERSPERHHRIASCRHAARFHVSS